MIYVLSGGQTGATLTVTSSDAGTITVSNTTLGKSYSKSVTAGGSAVFKGLQTGTWTVKLTDGSKTSTKTIAITSDYTTNIAYFSATISITYPATSTCVVTNSGGQTVASDTNTGSSTKTWTAMVNATGTYTVTATATDGSGNTKSQSVSITTDGQSKSVTLTYDLIIYRPGTNWQENTGGFKSNRSTVSYIDNGDTYSLKNETRTQGYQETYIYTENALDLTKYNTLHVKMQVEHTSGVIATESPHAVGMASAQTSGSASASISLSRETGTQTVDKTVDISKLTGNYYFRVSGRIGDNVEIEYILQDVYCTE